MFKTTIAVMASLMLVACGNDPKGTPPEGQNVEKADANETMAQKPEVPTLTLAGANDLTLTYFSLDS